MPDAPRQSRKLTTKQELFVNAYLGAANGNASEAARQAGYATPGPEGHRLLKNAEIAARVSQRLEESAISADQVLQELASVAMAPWHDFVEVTGRAKSGEATKVRSDIASKVKALELLGKHHQLFTEKQTIDMNIRDHRVIGVAQPELDALFQPAEKRVDA